MIEGPRDHTLIDALEGLTTQAYEGRLWRVTRDGRDPTLFFAGGNRWDDGTFEVLYTSLSREGALAEMHYHVARGQPIAPSKIKYRLHELQGLIRRHMESCLILSGKVSMKPAKRSARLRIS